MKIDVIKTHLGENKISVYEIFKNHDLIKKTGIEHVYETQLSSVQLAKKACEKIKDLNSRKIKLCIMVTQTPDDFLPANSIKLTDEINLSKNCFAFDINQGCSGFVQALCVVSKLVRFYDEILLVTVDKYRSKLRVDDRATNAVFSDGAAATIISKNGSCKIVYEDHYVDGSKRSLLYQTINKEENDGFLHMSGAELWMFTRLKVVPQICKAIEFCKMKKLNLEGIYMHQASKTVVDGISNLLPVHTDLIFRSYNLYGNTVSSTIPFMLERYPLKFKNENSVFIIAGFGVGLTSSIIVLGKDNG